ncbi:MAG: helix-turn-helix domain-containing protein [Candidatus Hodarchaeota archaeon]
MNDKQFKELMNKFDLLIKLNGINIVNQIETDKDKIILLSDIGLDARDIIKITGIRPQYVYDIRSKYWKEGE